MSDNPFLRHHMHILAGCKDVEVDPVCAQFYGVHVPKKPHPKKPCSIQFHDATCTSKKKKQLEQESEAEPSINTPSATNFFK